VNGKVNCVKAGVAWGTADANTNTKLAPGFNGCSGCVADTSGDCGNVNYPLDFRCPNGVMRGHVENVQLAVWSEELQLL
jgi:hypothetical protein